MYKSRLLKWSLPAALAIIVTACGGGALNKVEPTETRGPSTPKATKTPSQASLDDLAASVVMVAPGTLDGTSFTPVATGSGTIVDKSGLILTNYHVVDPNNVGAYDDIAVYVSKDPKSMPKLTYFGGLAAWDEDIDLAIIQITENRNGVEIDPADLDLQTVSLGDADTLDIGQDLTVLGYPAVGEGSLELTKGTVSGFLSAKGQKDAWIKTDARIAAGNSGGGAFDDEGKLVGIPTAIYYIEELGGEESGRIRPVNFVEDLLREAKAATEVVIPQIEQPTTTIGNLDVTLLSVADLGSAWEMNDETSLTNEDRATFYEDPNEAMAFYEEYGRIGGLRRVFDNFVAADAGEADASVIMVQVDLYDTAQGAAGAADANGQCEEFLDTMWEFITDMGFSFYAPDELSAVSVGEESCMFTAEEDVESADEPPLLLAFMGFRQGNALAVTGIFTMTDYDVQTPVLLAQAQSQLLGMLSAPLSHQ
jgi:S1-C subfamily serine protease